MKSASGRPVIEGGDFPRVIDDALHASPRYWAENMPEEEAQHWRKTAADAWGALDGGFGIIGEHMFRPEGQATLFVAPDDLQLALVAYGCERLDEGGPGVGTEVMALNGLLRSLDQLKAGQLESIPMRY